MFALQLWQYFRMVKTQVKRDLECNNGQELTVRMGVTTHAIITYYTNGATSQVGLLQVQKVVKTKNLILLMTHAKIFYIFPKSTFTKGTAREFLQFLNDWYHLK